MKLSKIVTFSVTALLLIGCSSSPKDAVNGMYDALADGDLETLQENATKQTAGLLAMAATMNCKVNKSDYSNKEDLLSACMQEAFGDIDIDNIDVTESSETRAYAMVTSSNNGKETTQKLDLIKVDDAWKVNIKK